jgi:Mg-chelatase subunit ChlD
LNGNAKVGVVRFATTSSIVTNLTTSANAVTKIRTTAYSGGGTNTAAAINSCRNVLASGTSPKQLLILLTDGIPSGITDANTQATEAKSNNITLIPVGVGADIRTTNLQTWGTNGAYLTVSVFDDLSSIVGNLTDATLCPK